jgi:hypothetical protein
MEIKMNEIKLPERISFNYEELKQELTEKVSMYETLVYTDEQIKQAKEDKANLNKLKKALNDERIRREREYMQPFNEFKAQVNEIISIIDKPVAVIDRQVKEYEEKQKQDKQAKIEAYWHEVLQADKVPEGVTFSSIFNPKWLNASVSMKGIENEINARLEQIAMDMKIIADLPEFSFEAMETYKNTLDVRTALNEANRLAEMAKRKAEQERIAAEAEAKKHEELPFDADRSGDAVANPTIAMPQEEVSEDFDNFIPDFAKKLEKKWVALKVNITADDETALLQFLKTKEIEFTVL